MTQTLVHMSESFHLCLKQNKVKNITDLYQTQYMVFLPDNISEFCTML